jgi:hypothetical protein
MANGGYWTVMERISVDDVKSFLDQNDFDVTAFREYFCERFNRALHRNIALPENFDSESIYLTVRGFKNKYSKSNDLRNILHYLIFHHYMVIYHRLNSEPEYRIMRAKILFHAERKPEGG